MASGVHTRRATSTPELDASNLNNVERLIFAQAVHEFGSDAWPEVAKLLSNHPLISQPKGAITPQSCSTLYQRLMEDAGLERSEADTGPRSEKHLRLAQRYYVARVTELRGLIASEEAKFKKLVTEIDEIRSGAWDDKILASMGAQLEKPGAQEEPTPEPQVSEPAQPSTSEDETKPAEEEESAKEAAMEEEQQQQLPAEQFTVIVVESSPAPEAEEKEEGSDNEAVNELIGNFSSDRPAVEAQDDIEPVVADAPEHRPAAEPQEDEMQVDEAPVKQEQEEDEPSDEQSVVEPAREIAQPEMEVEAGAEAEEEQPEADPEPAPTTRAEAKRKASDADTVMLDAQREKKRPREDSEPADEEDGAPKTRRRERTGGSDKRFQNMIGMLHSQISQHRYGNIFHNPIKKSEAPDYHDIVKRPMDLKTIKSRVKDGLISNSLEFQRDIFLMFANAMMYNRPGSEIYNMAEEMMVSSEREINAFRQTEGFHRM
ncbi:hypothetical protein BD309DRAFT_947080 [Dichomitus squalens]|uniref:Uncharacterized protein n=1 Tax=Dichomitus squalens TaxID=114155 RepID=A0A4V2K889_9APHY|nr:hypothetical protein BD309DRAFT_947080 [Dichomitus squalens]TBU59068.1 hypothetical protein BD310DRAFT_849811 [Dichomitus squalens]